MLITKSKKFVKQYKKLPVKIQDQFTNRLRLYLDDRNNHLLNIHSLHGKYHGLSSFNLSGDIRVVFDSSEENVLIFVAIRSHSELYS